MSFLASTPPRYGRSAGEGGPASTPLNRDSLTARRFGGSDETAAPGRPSRRSRGVPMRAAIFRRAEGHHGRRAARPGRSRSRPMPSSGWCWPACAARTSGTTGASPPTPSGRSATSSSASSRTSAPRSPASPGATSSSRRSSSATCRARTACNGSTISCVRGRQLRQRHDRRRPGRSRAGAARRAAPWCRFPAPATPTACCGRCSRSPTSWRPAITPPSAAASRRGDTVAVVGDGAVGLSAVLASKRLGAERIIALSRHPDRQRARPRVRRHRHRRGTRRRGRPRRSWS